LTSLFEGLVLIGQFVFSPIGLIGLLYWFIPLEVLLDFGYPAIIFLEIVLIILGTYPKIFRFKFSKHINAFLFYWMLNFLTNVISVIWYVSHLGL